MDQLPNAVQEAFTLGTATGVQLDVIGKYVGVSRTGRGFSSTITLSDADFLLLIQMAIIRNSEGSSLAEIQALLHQYFNNELFVFDYKNMHMSYLMDSSVGSQDLAELFVTEGLLPKPMGVQLAALIYHHPVDKFFGFRTYSAASTKNKPFNTYSSYDMDAPWLSYADAVAP